MLQSHDNPLCWEGNNHEVHQEENIIETRNTSDFKNIEETPQKPKEEIKISQDSNNNFDSKIFLRKKSANIIVRKSLDLRSWESRCSNPFKNFKNLEDFKYYIRGDSQILFSICNIDSNHLDEFWNHKLSLKKYSNSESDIENESDNWEFQIEDLSNCMKFIKNTFTKYKQKRRHRMILRVNNQENEDQENNNIFPVNNNKEYEGVQIKNYLRGISVNTKMQK